MGPKRSEAIRQGVPAKPRGHNKTDPARGSVVLDIVSVGCRAASYCRKVPHKQVAAALRRGGKASGILEDFFYRLFEVVGLRSRSFFAAGEAAARATVIAAVAAALAITV